MNSRTLRILEFHKICEQLVRHAGSEVGKERVFALTPGQDAEQVKTLLTQTSEAESILIRGGQNPIAGFDDVRPLLKRLHAITALSMKELLSVASALQASRTARERLLQHEEAISILKYMAGQLCARRGVEDEIYRCIISEEEIADGASPELSRIRRQMRIVNERAREKLNAMVKNATMQKYLQEPIITIRNGRFAIPVKQEHRQQIPGLVHDQSGSGATLFIEPMAVVELGNEYKRLLGLEQEEIERILAGLTALMAPYGEELYSSIHILAELDCIFAKASYAREMRAVCPRLSADMPIRIVAGRHPLIPKEHVVPVDVWLGDEFQTLIITGPNTGGKTVTLKTIGLFAIMAQAGLFIPAEEGSTLRFFEAVYADIGDEQSIEQSLSTFSSHMNNIVEILREADERSMVLLDELGAGTDPVEGAALAMSILETLHEKGCMTAATTHYSEIKAFALTRPGMENASMEFDVDKLLPTYRLFIGIPGKSNAFEIAGRLGLDNAIIGRARTFLKKEDVEFEDVMQHAQTQRQRAEEDRAKAQSHRYELERLKSQIEAEKEKLHGEREILRQKAKQEARMIVRESREEMEAIISELRKLKHVDNKELERAIQHARDTVRERESSLLDIIGETEDIYMDDGQPEDLQPGDMVRLLHLGQNATVLKLLKQNGEVQVQAGAMKMMVKLSDTRKISLGEKQAVSGGHYRPQVIRSVSLSLDVRGKLVDEALIEVDRYIDDAVIQGRTEVQIIHGKGTGALRSGIQGYLKRHTKVKEYRLGNYGEGDAGVTIVTIKE